MAEALQCSTSILGLCRSWMLSKTQQFLYCLFDMFVCMFGGGGIHGFFARHYAVELQIEETVIVE